MVTGGLGAGLSEAVGALRWVLPVGGTPAPLRPSQGLGAATGHPGVCLAAVCPSEGPGPEWGPAGVDGVLMVSGMHIATGVPTSRASSRLGFQSLSELLLGHFLRLGFSCRDSCPARGVGARGLSLRARETAHMPCLVASVPGEDHLHFQEQNEHGGQVATLGPARPPQGSLRGGDHSCLR